MGKGVQSHLQENDAPVFILSFLNFNNSIMSTYSFFVVNDGSPIDFSISHGSLVQGGSGRAEVTMEVSMMLTPGTLS